MTTTIILNKEDINNPLHPNMWEELCESLRVPRDSEQIEIKVSAVKAY